MRIVQCIPTLMGGGAERQYTYLVEGLVRLGHDVHAVYMSGGPNEERLARSGATRHVLGWRQPYDPRLVSDVAAVVLRSHADVVQTWMRRMDVAGGMAARTLRRGWVFSERTVSSHEPGVRQALLRRAMLSASAIVANSEEGAKFWRRPRANVFVVPNAVPWDEIQHTRAAPRASLGVPPACELLVYVGRFDPMKNTPFLAEIVVEFLRSRPQGYAVCCGVGLFLDQFQSAVERAGVSARCLTPGYRDDAWAVMKAADVMVSPSTKEGRPNAVLEAMACGVPLVVSDIAEHRECIPPDGALFVALGDTTGAVAALARCLDDRDAALVRAERASASVRSLSIESVSRRYGAIYELLVRRNDSG